MTEDEMAAIRERADRATPGPWAQQRGWPMRVVPEGHRGRPWGASSDPKEDDTEYARCIVESKYDGSSPPGEFPHRRVDRAQSMADAEFVAHARADVPALLDALAAEREMCDALADALEALCSHASREPEAPESYEPALRALLAWSASREADRG